MRVSTSLLALAATASAAVLPRSELGSWDITVVKSTSASGYQSQTATAVYTSDSYPEGVTKECKYEYNPRAEGEKETNECDDGFSYEFDGQSEPSVHL